MSEAARNLSPDNKVTLTYVLELMKADNLLDDITMKKLEARGKRNKSHPLETIASFEIKDRRTQKPISLDALSKWFAAKVGMEYEKVEPMNVNMESLSGLFPTAYAQRLRIVPLSVSEKEVYVGTSEPFDTDWVREMSRVIKKEIKLKFVSPLQIQTLLDELSIVSSAFKNVTRHRSAQEKKLLKDGNIEELDKLLEQSKNQAAGNKDSGTVKIVDWLMNYAYQERASDIHLEPRKGLAQIRFRVDGKLKIVYKMDPDLMLNVISRLKILGDMKIDEKRKPQDGRIKRFLENGRKIEMRLSVVPSHYGEKMVIRIFDQQVANRDLGFIGFSEEDQKSWEEMIFGNQGLVLVTGPTGSGKTTTLYTSLNIVSTEEVNVCTVEDPIEMTVDTFNQIQVNQAVDLTFAEAIRAFLRQDPDIIMVGEIRDLETAEAAVQASLTGHMVFSTLHTNGALATIQRLIDIGLQTFLINSSLRGILAQRLVRKLCDHCKKEVETPKDIWMTLTEESYTQMPEKVYEAVGCESCKETGFEGRLCIYELVKFTDEIKSVITPNIEITDLKDRTKGKFTSFRENCAKKVIAGETTLGEVLKVVY